MKAYVPALAIVVSSAMEIQAQSQPWLIVMMNGDTLKQCASFWVEWYYQMSSKMKSTTCYTSLEAKINVLKEIIEQ